MPGLQNVDNEPAAGSITPEVLRGVRPARRNLRRLASRVMWAGAVVFGLGLAVGLAAGGPSVPATVLLLSGLAVVIASLLVIRLLFWSGVYRRDRAAAARRGRKSGP